MMSKYVMVDCISQFRMRYCVEVPDDVGEELHFKDGTRSFPITPEEYASDTVICEDAKEFTQHYLGETIVDTREVTLEEALAQFRKDEPMFGESWNDEQIMKSAITEIGHSEQEKMREEEERWKNGC
jgi:hypothetical protein